MQVVGPGNKSLYLLRHLVQALLFIFEVILLTISKCMVGGGVPQ